MRHGMRREAVEHFREASRPDGRLGRAYLLLALALVLPGRLAAATHRYWDWLA
jgi:Flp pilus assembly protein TadD